MSRKKSTSSDESSSGSTSETSSTSGSSGSTGSSVSDSDTSSSSDHVKPTQNNSGTRLQNSSIPTNTNNVTTKSSTTFRQKNSDLKQPQNKTNWVDKPNKENISKTKSLIVRDQRLSKSSIYSSEDENNPVKKSIPIKSANLLSKKNFQNDTKKPTNTCSGGKAPPSVVKQQNQTITSKLSSKQKPDEKKDVHKHKNPSQEKNKSIFSPENSSDSDVKEEKFNEKIFHRTNALPKQTKLVSPPIKSKPKYVVKKHPQKTTERKVSTSSETVSSTEGTTSNSSSHSDGSDDSSSHSSPPSKKNPTVSQKKQTVSKILNKAGNNSKNLVLSDSDGQTSILPRKQQTVRKLTRSSSTRKSKHLTGKPSDTDSDIELDKSRSISKSPAKKSSVSTLNVVKSKTKVKKHDSITTTLIKSSEAMSPIPEIQKCPVEGCDSTGHLSGNHASHFLPEACPIFHNMSTSECKDRTVDRRIREEEQSKIILQYGIQNHKIPTPEQKMYLMKIRESRIRFKPFPQFHLNTPINTDKIKVTKHILDRKREPNLTGLVSDYDLQLFREAQAIASEMIEKDFVDLPVGKGIKYILMGKHQMKVWYQSPYPEDVARIPKMFICEFCLRYQKSEISMKRHSMKCVWRHPPGDEIYRKGKLQVWQVDGKKHKQFCQNLCLLAKFFLDHKTLYYEVEPFLFYVMTLANYEGCHIVGYFSKEKNSYLNYNVSCILTLPPYQRKGYGRLLIDFSYLLTRVENKIGSPEKPLSDLGLISYRSYWKDVLLDFLCTRTGTTLSIKDLSQEMAINSYDIVSTLQALGMMKYWKGKHIVLKKQDVLEEYEERIKRRGNFPTIDSSCLRWNPFIPPQTSGTT